MSKEKLKVFGYLAIIVALLFVGSYVIKANRASNEKDTVYNAVFDKCLDAGLEGITVTLDFNKNYDWYDVTVESVNYDKLTYEEMIELNSKLSIVGNAYVKSFKHYEDTYTIYDNLEVSKNSVKVYYSQERADRKAESDMEKEAFISMVNGAREITDDDKAMCWTLALREVKASLKSPSSAKFPFAYNSDGVSIVKDGNNFYVTAWVDADNSFGANIRNKFIVTIEKPDADYEVLSCEFFD